MDKDPIIKFLGFSTAGIINKDRVFLIIIYILAAIRAYDSFIKILYLIFIKYLS